MKKDPFSKQDNQILKFNNGNNASSDFKGKILSDDPQLHVQIAKCNAQCRNANSACMFTRRCSKCTVCLNYCYITE